MTTNFIELSKDSERNLLYVSFVTLALNAVFSTELRDGIPEWGRVSPFDCLYQLIHHIAELLIHVEVDSNHRTQNEEISHNGNEIQTNENSSHPAEALLSEQIHEPSDIIAYPPSIILLLKTLNITAGVVYLFVMTRKGFRWSKTFASFYQLYWLLSCKLLPRPSPLTKRDPAAQRICQLAALWGFSITIHLLVWLLWSPQLYAYSTRKYWSSFLLHCSIGIFVTAIACLPNRSTDGTMEAFLYLSHVMCFIPAWLSILWAKMYDQEAPDFLVNWNDRIGVETIYGYDIAFAAFIIAKGERTGHYRWPSAVLAACHLAILIILVEVRVFQF